jgi:hypothetical protein
LPEQNERGTVSYQKRKHRFLLLCKADFAHFLYLSDFIIVFLSASEQTAFVLPHF